MFQDEDLFMVLPQAVGQVTRGKEAGTQTDLLLTSEQETETLTSTIPFECQVDTSEFETVSRVPEDQVNQDELLGFLRSRFRYLNNSLKEYAVLQSSKSRLNLTETTGHKEKFRRYKQHLVLLQR